MGPTFWALVFVLAMVQVIGSCIMITETYDDVKFFQRSIRGLTATADQRYRGAMVTNLRDSKRSLRLWLLILVLSPFAIVLVPLAALKVIGAYLKGVVSAAFGKDEA